MNSFRYITVLFAFFVLSCIPDFPRESDLSMPRVLAISLSDPVVETGAVVQSSILLYDPQWRKPVIHWALAVTPIPTEALRYDYGNPATLSPESGFFYLGQGTGATFPVPSLPEVEAELAAVGYEKISLPLVAFVDWPDGERDLAFKQVRIILRSVVESLIGTGPESVTAVEERMQFLDNRNPELGPLSFAARDTKPTEDDRINLPSRKAMSVEVGRMTTTRGGLVRAELPVTDADNEDRVRGDDGYNILRVSFYAEDVQLYGLSISSADIAFENMEQNSAFDEPDYKPTEGGIVYGVAVANDRYGGAAWRGFSVEAESVSDAARTGAGGAALVRAGSILFWQPLSSATTLTAGTKYLVEGILKRPDPLGVQMPFLIDDVSWMPLTQATDGSSPETLLYDLISLHEAYGRAVTWPVEIIRISRP